MAQKKQNKTRQLVIQFAEYMITGGVWFWSGYILIVLLDGPLGESFGDSLGLFYANMIGNTVGFTLNFILERYWVFRSKKQAKIGVMAKRYIIYTVLNALILNYFILFSLRKWAGIGPEIGQFIASGFFTAWNYYWYKTWVFRNEEHKKPRRTRHHA